MRRFIFFLGTRCLRGKKAYEGIIVGWGAYMLIQGSEKRVAFLRSLRELVFPGAPILLSFFHRGMGGHRHRAAGLIANTTRQLLRRPRLEIGDALSPNYVHYFTEKEVNEELQHGGFDPEFYSDKGYGHAVGLAAEKTNVLNHSKSLKQPSTLAPN